MKNHKRIWVILVVGLVGAAYFWIASRYPNLNKKALMAHSATVADTLSVWPLFEVRPEFSFARKVTLSTLNWCNDNWRGMTFGVFFAAIFLTLAGYFPLPATSNRFLNSFFGFLLGTPLGVCVNCAAPIFKGILKSRRVETAFAAMLSSPTMNVVVLTMLFSLFPLYLALTKILFTLLSIFIGIPFISWALGSDPIRDLTPDLMIGKLPAAPLTAIAKRAPPSNESWIAAAIGSLCDLAASLWYMTRKTVPLMLLAGILGSLLSHSIPLDAFIGTPSGLGAILLAAAVGVSLPTPIAFDIILVNALFSHGLSPSIALTLLCTLGIYSIYSFFVVWTSASKKWALSLFAWFFVWGSIFGLAASSLHRAFYIDRNVASFNRLKTEPRIEAVGADENSRSLVPSDAKRSAPLNFKPLREQNGILLSSAPFQKRVTRPGPAFLKKEGPEIGLVRGFRYGIRDYPDPFWIGRGTGAGEYDNDGWVDLIFGTNHGFALYKNMGGWFQLQDQPNRELDKLIVYAVALVDLNNDGWLDIFFSTFNQGNYVILNHQGTFDFFHPIPVPNNHAVLTISPSFGDLAGKGFLDILNGNMALGIITGMNEFGPRRPSSIVYNRDLHFTEVPLGGYSGEGMASLISDLNNDGIPDIGISHDFVVPDNYFLGTASGAFRPVSRADHFIPKTPFFSMSIDTGDLNNDQVLDLVIGGTIETKPETGKLPIDGWSPARYGEQKWDSSYCTHIHDEVSRKNCLVNREADHLIDFEKNRNIKIGDCSKISEGIGRQSCLLSTMWLLVTHDDFRPDCRELGFDVLLGQVCEILSSKGRMLTPKDFPGSLPQENDSFVFLMGKDGRFHDINENQPAKLFDHPGGWTWNMRIADFDNDGWQDIFNSEGAVRKNDYGFNVFMKNNAGKGFEQKQFTYNLVDDFGLYSFVAIDSRNDGYLDIIGNSAEGPIQVYENNFPEPHHSLAVSLRDGRGNRFGIGAKIYLSYDGKRKGQVREIKAGGGYLSYDPPVAYFGLGEIAKVDELRVKWRDGKESILQGPFPAGYHYRIERKP